MYVCLCHAITDSDIQQAVLNEGVGNISELKKALGVGTSCGSCIAMARAIIDQTIIDESLFKEVS